MLSIFDSAKWYEWVKCYPSPLFVFICTARMENATRRSKRHCLFISSSCLFDRINTKQSTIHCLVETQMQKKRKYSSCDFYLPPKRENTAEKMFISRGKRRLWHLSIFSFFSLIRSLWFTRWCSLSNGNNLNEIVAYRMLCKAELGQNERGQPREARQRARARMRVKKRSTHMNEWAVACVRVCVFVCEHHAKPKPLSVFDCVWYCNIYL